jgi:hypothetical protein
MTTTESLSTPEEKFKQAERIENDITHLAGLAAATETGGLAAIAVAHDIPQVHESHIEHTSALIFGGVACVAGLGLFLGHVRKHWQAVGLQRNADKQHSLEREQQSLNRGR